MSGPLELELQLWATPTRTLGREVGSSSRATYALNHQAISPAPAAGVLLKGTGHDPI